MTPRQLEKEALKHAKAQARQMILQAKIDRAFRKEQLRAARKIDSQENGWWRVRTFLYWLVVLIASIPLSGLPLLLALGWHVWKKSRA